MSEIKWIPKVGEEFEYVHDALPLKWMRGKAIFVGDRHVVWLDPNGVEWAITTDSSFIFKPIKSDRDIAVQEMISITEIHELLKDAPRDVNYDLRRLTGKLFEKLYDAGYRKVQS